MAIATGILAAIGVAAGVAGTGIQIAGYIRAGQAQKAQAAAFQKGERLREKQMNLEARRRNREIIRNSIIARSMALSNAANQGALFGSGLVGGLGEIGGSARRAVSQTAQNQNIGQGIFAANREGGAAQAAEAAAGTMVNFGAGLASLGGSLVQNIGTFNRVGTYLGSK